MFISAFLFQAQAQMLFDFDTTNADVGFVSWAGTGFEKITNPHSEGINVSANVGKYTHAGNDSGLENALVDGATPLTPFDFTATPFISVKVWVSKPVAVSIKLQNYPEYSQGVEQKIDVTDINQWVNLIFSYEGITATNYDRVQIYFDKDQSGGSVAGDVFYFDDYQKGVIAPAATTTFDPANGDTDVQTFASMDITSNFAMRMIDDSEITDLSTIVWLKKTTETGTDVAFTGSISDGMKTITIIPADLLEYGTTYFYGINADVVEYSSDETAVEATSASFTTRATAPEMVVYNDFETDGTSLCSLVETMGDPGPPFSLVADPADAGNQVLLFEKNNSWGGWSRVHLELNAPMDLTGDKVFSMRVYSPIETYVRLKIGNAAGDGGHNYEVDADVNVVAGWQTLYFDFSAKYATDSDAVNATDFTHISIYFGGGDNTANNYYLDDFKGALLGEEATLVAPNFPIDFEEGTVYDYSWTGFGNASGEVVSNPDASGENVSDMVTEITKADGAETWAGVSLNMDDAIDFTESTIVRIKVYSPRADVPILFKIENSANGDIKAEVQAMTTMANTWEVLEFDISLSTVNEFSLDNSYDVVVLFADFGAVGAGETFYFDNINLDKLLPALPLTFEEGDVYDYAWAGFGNANPSVVANPDASGENTSDKVVEISKADGAQTWAGSNMKLDAAIDFSVSTTIKVKVYSPRADVPILFKIENSTNGDIKAEVLATTTVANTWEVLEFDLSLSTVNAFSLDNEYDVIVLFPDFGASGAAEVFYFDDIELKEETIGFDELNKIDFLVYPNPASDYLYISNSSDLKRIEIYSITGQRIKTIETIENRIQISELPQGVYVISAENNSGEVFSTKFFKK